MENETLRTYQQIATHFSETHYDPEFWRKEFVIFRELLPSGKIVEIGCGAGRDAVLLTKAGYDYLGTDGSPVMLTEARKRLPHAKFVAMNFFHPVLIANYFDGFWASASLLHAEKARLPEALQNIHSILTPEGIGFISVKQFRDIDEAFIREEKYGGAGRNFSFYKELEFGEIMTANGFSVVRHHITETGDTNWLCFYVRKS